ncbi:MAG: hypothetical protein ACXVKA_07875 [Acidimicrobiia bacterium]
MTSAFIVPVAVQVDDASATNFVSCDHPVVTVKAHPPLGLFGGKGHLGPPRHITVQIATHRTAQDLYCSSPYSTVKHGVVRTIAQARLRLTLRRSSNDCDAVKNGVWQGKASIVYQDDNGRRIAITKRVGTFHVLDYAASSEGPGVVEISASPSEAPATGPFAGTNLEIKVTYDPIQSPYTNCMNNGGGWTGLPTPTYMYWEEF